MPSRASETRKTGDRPVVSVIVPALNEAARLPGLHRQLQAQSPIPEIILVDGGSSDGTASMARALGIRTLKSAPGRGQQLKAGADAASGEILLFLHADSQLPAGAIARLVQTLRDEPETVGGNFRLLFDGNDGFSRWLNGFYRWIRSHGFYYGDSAIFVRRGVYDEIGGIRPIALMEDYDFIRRMEKVGQTCCIGDPPMITSSRRFQGRHPIAIVYGWLKIHFLFHLGVSPDFLARIYNSKRHAQPKSAPPRPQERSNAPLSDQS